jgi:phosphoenolpyruvate carboxykinase (GTP)
LSFADRSERLPKIFHVNWFRQDQDGKFLWPGFGENLRVIRWIIDRCEKRVDARETPIGFLPAPADLDTNGLDITDEALNSLLSIDVEQWKVEMESVGEYLETYGDRLPEGLRKEHAEVVKALNEAR